MRLIIISLAALFVSLMFVIGGNAYLLTYIGVRLGAEGVSPTQVGFVMVCYSVGFAIGSHWSTRFVATVGHIRTFAAFTALTAMASISYPLLDSVYFWALLRLVGGITAAGLYVIIESWFSAVATNNNRATLFALYQVAAYGSSALAQLTVGYSDPLGSEPFTIAGLILLAAIIPLSLSRMQSPHIEQAPKSSLLALYREAPLGLTSAFVGGILLGAYYSLVPLFGSLTGMSISQVSQVMTASVLMALLLAWPVGWICDRVQRSKVLLVIVTLCSLLSVGVSMATEQSFMLRLVFSAVLLGLLTLINSLAVALTHDRIDSSARVAASSALMLCYGIGSIIGPVIGSMLMEEINPQAMFIGFAIGLVALALYVRYRQNQMPPMPVAAQEQYVASMPETQLSQEFDPRHEVEEENNTIEDIFPDEWVEAWGPDSDEEGDGEKSGTPEPGTVSEEIEVGSEMIGMAVIDPSLLHTSVEELTAEQEQQEQQAEEQAEQEPESPSAADANAAEDSSDSAAAPEESSAPPLSETPSAPRDSAADPAEETPEDGNKKADKPLD